MGDGGTNKKGWLRQKIQRSISEGGLLFGTGEYTLLPWISTPVDYLEIATVGGF